MFFAFVVFGCYITDWMVSRNSKQNSPVVAGSRERILSAAREHFSANGFDGTSVDQIALSAGVKKPLVFHYFPSKQAILLELLQGLWSGLMENRARNVRDIPPDDLPFAQMKIDFRYLCEHRDLVRISAMEELKDASKGGDSVFMNRWRMNLEAGMEGFEKSGWGFRIGPDTLVSMLLIESLFKWYLAVEDAFVAVGGIGRDASREAFLRQAEIVMRALDQGTFRAGAGKTDRAAPNATKSAKTRPVAKNASRRKP